MGVVFFEFFCLVFVVWCKYGQTMFLFEWFHGATIFWFHGATIFYLIFGLIVCQGRVVSMAYDSST